MTDASDKYCSELRVQGNGRRRLAICLLAGLSFWQRLVRRWCWCAVSTPVDDVDGTFGIARQARELSLSLVNAETGQRGYLLSLDSEYLEPYQRAIRRWR